MLIVFTFTVVIFLLFVCNIDSYLLGKFLGLRPREFSVRTEKGIVIETSDGIKLRADIYHPETKLPKPTILVRIPFSNTFQNRFISNVVGKMWAERGYHVVIQGTRGCYKSEGVYYPLPTERQDGIDTLHWLQRQKWFNGSLGMWGGSYFGYTQLSIADQTNPGPSALIVQLASTNFYEMFYHGGAFSIESALVWSLWSTQKDDSEVPFEVIKRGYSGFPLIKADDRARHDIPFFNDWVKHDQEDSYWQAINVRKQLKSLHAPVLMMAGWYDPFLQSQLRDYAEIKNKASSNIAKETKLIIGPWGHAFTVKLSDGSKSKNYRLESLEPTIAWYDQHLLKRNNAKAMKSPVKIFVMGKNIWRGENEWPLARAKYTPFYLRSKGNANTVSGEGYLSTLPPEVNENPDNYSYDPMNPVPSAGGTMIGSRAGVTRQNEIEKRKDVLVYSTEPLNQDMEITGPIKIILNVATSAPATDFTAKLVDVYPDGSAFNVSNGILRRSYKSSLKPTEIRIDLWPTSMVFFKGHKVRLEVSSSDFPRFDRNPNTGQNIVLETKTIVAKQTIFHDPLHLSQIILPVIP